MSTNYITQITDTGGTTHYIAEGVDTRIFTATCSTTASTTAKIATLDDDTGFSLVAGVKVAVTFINGNSAATPTLRVDGTTIGTSKTIAIPSSATAYTTGNGTTYNTWGAYETVLFTYTGTYWAHDTSGYLGYLAYNTASGRQAKITASGILKGDGAGGVTAATAGTDYAAASHAHGNVTSGGDITATAPTIANGDQLIINDDSASKITNGPTFDGSTTTSFLSKKGTWETPLPSQNGNSGKYLTTNGSAASWANVDVTSALNDKITYGNTDLTAGSSPLGSGIIYLFYE